MNARGGPALDSGRPRRTPRGCPNMADEPTRAIDDLLLENRTFPPPEGFKEASLVAGTFLYDEAAERLRAL